MRDRIRITKSMLPYSFNIPLVNVLYNLTVYHNTRNDLFTITLKKDGQTICEGEPIIYGVPLFKDIYKAGEYPALNIVPIDESGQQNTVTFENLDETVFLTIDNGGD